MALKAVAVEGSLLARMLSTQVRRDRGEASVSRRLLSWRMRSSFSSDSPPLARHAAHSAEGHRQTRVCILLIVQVCRTQWGESPSQSQPLASKEHVTLSTSY